MAELQENGYRLQSVPRVRRQTERTGSQMHSVVEQGTAPYWQKASLAQDSFSVWQLARMNNEKRIGSKFIMIREDRCGYKL